MRIQVLMGVKGVKATEEAFSHQMRKCNTGYFKT
jgi:hypothetical protein